jgi:hypothetical protein
LLVKGQFKMSVFEKQRPPDVTHTYETKWPQIRNIALAATSTVGTVFYGKELINQFFSNDIDLSTVGLATLSTTGLFVGVTGASERTRNRLEKFKGRRFTAIAGTIIGLSLLSVAALSDNDSNESSSIPVSSVDVDIDVDVDRDTQVEVSPEAKTDNNSDWPCEIYAPIQSNNGSPENIGSAVALQRFLATEVGYPENQIDGVAGSLTGAFVDIYQALPEVNVDVSLPWGPETCFVSPFGDDDPNTPATGGWEAGWQFYLDNIEQSQ